MASNITRMPPQSRAMSPQPRSGDPAQQWFWDGSNWNCGCDDGGFPPFGPPVFSGPTNQPPWYPGANGGVSFGTVAPANPVRGHFWWDGLVLWMFDGAAWVDTSGGGGATPPSTTPPANPSNGQQWFNGTTLFVWDGNAWIPVSATKSTISATAPPNPNPGDTWWNGTQMRIWDGTTWQLIGPGATVGPVATTTEMFRVTNSVAGTITPATWSIYPIGSTPTINLNGNWNPSTKVFTPGVAGTYAFRVAFWPGAGNTEAIAALLFNDTGGPYPVPLSAQTICIALANGDVASAFGMQHFNGTTDFCRLWLYNSSTSAVLANYGGVPIIDAWILP